MSETVDLAFFLGYFEGKLTKSQGIYVVEVRVLSPQDEIKTVWADQDGHIFGKINHSCTPNIAREEYTGRYLAVRPIDAGDELVMDYGGSQKVKYCDCFDLIHQKVVKRVEKLRRKMLRVKVREENVAGKMLRGNLDPNKIGAEEFSVLECRGPR